MTNQLPKSGEDKIRRGYEQMFVDMSKRKEKDKSKPSYDKFEFNPTNHHAYFAVYRPAGHITKRIQLLNKGEKGRTCSKIFAEVANPLCDYLIIYQVHADTGEVTAYVPILSQ